ncbi:MAG: hypothetical protein ABIF12_00165 [bacterium]
MLKKIYLFKDGKILLNDLLSSVLSLAGALNDKKNIDLDRFLNFEGRVDYFYLNINNFNLSSDIRSKYQVLLNEEFNKMELYIKSKIDNSLRDEDVEYRY